MSRLSPWDARALLAAIHIPHDSDFHTLDSEQVERLLSVANQFGYRKPKNANGSRARYFHAYLSRLANRHLT